MINELEHYGVKGMKWGERKEEKLTNGGTAVSETRQKSISSNRMRRPTKVFQQTSEVPTKSSSSKSSLAKSSPNKSSSIKSPSNRQETISSNRVRKTESPSQKQPPNSSWKSSDKTSSGRQKRVQTDPSKVAYPDNLKGRSLLDTKVSDTSQWIEENGASLSVDAALEAVKKIIPKRRSSGTDVANALKNVNSQGGSLLLR